MLSYSYHSCNWPRLWGLWQSLLTDFSTNKLEYATIENLYRAYSKLLLKPNKYCSPWRKSWHLFIVLASSIFLLPAFIFFQCQNNLQEICCNTCLSALIKWLLGYIEGFDNRVFPQYFSSSSAIALTSISWPLCHYLVFREVWFLWLQYLQYKDFYGLTCSQ